MTSPVPQPPVKRSWEEIVEGNKGSLMFFPEKFIESIKAWKAKRDELQKLVAQAGKIEFEMTTMLHQNLLGFRQYLEENGRGDEAWTTDIGIEMNALKEGKYIATIREQQK